jgi:16S rRNA processing protein RimM
MEQTRILVGQIGAAHGLKGEVKLIGFTQEPLKIANCGPLEIEGREERLTITGIRQSKSSVIVKFEGIGDRTEAERLKGLKLYVARERLPALEKDTYYHADLIGLEVKTAEKRLGNVIGVSNFGAGDLLEVETAGTSETLLVPFSGAKVDLAKGVIEVELPEGFLENE